MDKQYARDHQIIPTGQWDFSTVKIERDGWDKETLSYSTAVATYIPKKDPRVLVSWELYIDGDDRFFSRPANPKIGDKVNICNLQFTIAGFISRYNMYDDEISYDVVLEKI